MRQKALGLSEAEGMLLPGSDDKVEEKKRIVHTLQNLKSSSASEHETEKVFKLITVWSMKFLVFSRFTNSSSQAHVWKCFTHSS